jgi:hypothetical protein
MLNDSEQLTNNQKRLLEIYKEFKEPSFDERKIKDLILEIKETDPNLETQLSEDAIWKSDRDTQHNFISFFDFSNPLKYTISGLALRAGILSQENKTLDCLKFLSDQNLATKDHLAIIVEMVEEEEEKLLSVLGTVIGAVVEEECDDGVDKNKTREIINYYLEHKSQIEKAEAIVGYSSGYSSDYSKKITLSNYLVSNVGELINDHSILTISGLQFSDIFDEKVKAEIYENSYLTTLGVFVKSDKSELKHMEFLLKEGANPNSVAQVNNDGSTVTIFDFALAKARQSGNYEIPKILILHCADYGNFDEDINCPEDIKAEINKIKNAKRFFDGDISVDLNDINERFLKKLCKESGIPSHFLSDTEETNVNYNKIKKEFKELASNSKETIPNLLAEILHAGNQLDFPSITPLDHLNPEGFSAKDKEIHEKTKESYEINPHLTPAQFLNKDDLDQKSLILFRNLGATNRFFEETNKFSEETNQFFLPKEQLETLNKLKEIYFSTPSHLREVLSAQAQELMDVKQEFREVLSAQAQELTDVKQKLSELKSETAEQKEERLTQEGLKKAVVGNAKITNFFTIRAQDPSPRDPSPLPAKRERSEGEVGDFIDSKSQRTSGI